MVALALRSRSRHGGRLDRMAPPTCGRKAAVVLRYPAPAVALAEDSAPRPGLELESAKGELVEG